MRFLLLPALTLLIAGAAHAQSDNPIVNGELGIRIDEYMSRMAAFGLSGALLAAKDGEILVRKGYGLADDARSIPVTADMPFLIASLSKQFTAAALLKLEMQGHLSVSDTVGRFFPDAPADKRGITIHQLLTHTAGLPYLEQSLAPGASRDETMREILSLPLETSPGAGFAYSNPGYALLAGIVERASGQKFEAYLRRNLFDPAGMQSTGFLGDEPHARLDRLHSYSGTNDEGPTSTFLYGADLAGAGSIYSTAGDLYRWEQALAEDAVLSAEAREKLFTAHVPVQGPMSYTYGWNTTSTIRGTRLIFHAGDLGGYNVEYRRYVDEGLVLIFLSNRRVNGTGYRMAVMNPLSLMIAEAPYPAPPAVVDIPATELEHMAGRYTLPGGGAILAWTEGHRLMMGAEGQDGLLALAGTANADSPALAELARLTREVVLAAAHGNFDPLKKRLHPSYPFEDVKNALEADMRGLSDSLGPFRGVEITGSVMPTPMSAQTFFRLRFEHGEVGQMYGWGGDRIAAIGERVPRALPTRFAPVSASVVASFDPFTGHTVRVEIDKGTDGKVIGLNIVMDRTSVTALRASDRL